MAERQQATLHRGQLSNRARLSSRRHSERGWVRSELVNDWEVEMLVFVYSLWLVDLELALCDHDQMMQTVANRSKFGPRPQLPNTLYN